MQHWRANEDRGAGFGTKLSSAGLVYKHFGRAIVAGILGQPEDAADSETVYLAVYKNFMEAIDGIDNGCSHSPPPSILALSSISMQSVSSVCVLHDASPESAFCTPALAFCTHAMATFTINLLTAPADSHAWTCVSAIQRLACSAVAASLQ